MKEDLKKTLKEIKIAVLFIAAFLLLMMVWSYPIMVLVAVLSIGHFYSKMNPEIFFPIASVVWLFATYYAYKVIRDE